jgi:phosphoglycerol transferase MdoB-like AlkP superfamily enzyme
MSDSRRTIGEVHLHVPATSAPSLARRVLRAPRDAALWTSRNRACVAALVLASCLPLSVRLMHMIEQDLAPRPVDLAGVVSDLGIGLSVSLLLALAWRTSLILFVALAALWTCLNAGYYEFLREYASPYFLIHVGNMLDGTFLAGSGTHLSHPWHFAVAAVVMVAAIGWFAAGSRKVAWTRLLAAAAVLGFGVEFLPDAPEAAAWRQRNLVSSNVGDVIVRVLAPEVSSSATASGAVDLGTLLEPDLAGVPILGAAARRNVILIFVESLSGGHLPSLAAAHGNTSVLELPALDAVARDNLAFSTFVTHQKQSNRGIFAALCGTYPHLEASFPEMADIAGGGPRDCLPAVLRSNGYNTLFMKSADSRYMQMGAFMRNVGFYRAYGEEGFPPGLPRAQWGLDDATLYGESLKEIDTLAKQGKPYFLTLFTSSTHHPFNVPESFAAAPGQEPKPRAWAFADHAIGDYLAALKARGVLDDTLVLVMSDEAAVVTEPVYRKDDLLNGITENWGLMVALSPEKARGRVDAAYQQADLPLSVLDYLGLGAQAKGFIGRSLFRSYATPRAIYFANIYKRRIYEYNERQDLTVCDEGLVGCIRYDATGGSLFSSALSVVDRSARPGAIFQAIRNHSMQSPVQAPAG